MLITLLGKNFVNKQKYLVYFLEERAWHKVLQNSQKKSVCSDFISIVNGLKINGKNLLSKNIYHPPPVNGWTRFYGKDLLWTRANLSSNITYIIYIINFYDLCLFRTHNNIHVHTHQRC